MDEEAGFLSAIHQTPAEETARLAYADWLDEQGDPPRAAKSEFVRLELRLLHAPDDDPVHLDGPERLRQLATALPADWLAVLRRAPVEGCRNRLRLACPERWDRLASVGTPHLRFCNLCDRTVHFCETRVSARERVTRGECVAISPAVVRYPNDIGAPPPVNRFSVIAVAAPLLDRPRAAINRPRLKRSLSYCGQQRTPPPPLPDDGVGVRDLPPVSRRRRTGGRGRNRSIERQDWEEQE